MASLVLDASDHAPEEKSEKDNDEVHPVITIFTVSSCRFCKRAKSLMKEKGWRYNEIDLGKFPTSKENMLKACSRLTVPQIFFGSKWMGGAVDLFSLDERGQLEDALVDSVQVVNDTIKTLLQVPDESEARVVEGAPALTEVALMIGGIKQTYSQVYQTLTGCCQPRKRSTRERMKEGRCLGESKDGETGARTYSNSSEESGSSDSSNTSGSSGGSGGSGGSAGSGGSGGSGGSADSGDSGRSSGGDSSGSSTSTSSSTSSAASSTFSTTSSSSSTISSSTISSSTSSTTNTNSDDSEQQHLRTRLSVAVVPILEIKDRTHFMYTYRSCFLGTDLVDVLMNRYNLRTRDEAVEIGIMLFELKMFAHVTTDHVFSDEKYFYRFACHEEPLVLNTWRTWNDRVDPDAVSLVRRLKVKLDKIMNKYRNNSGLVAYDDVAKDPKFRKFEEATCELQQIHLERLEIDERIAFCLNVYNMMVKHAFTKVGRPESNMRRDFFFSNISYNIGGHVFSLNELENGVLRGNKRPAGFHFLRPFGSGDPRMSSVIEQPDPRLHFALNCGAKSCPPVKEYTRNAVREELRVVAMAFCSEDENVAVDQDKCEVRISKLLYWYMYDFAPTEKLLLTEILPQWLEGEKKKVWLDVVNSGRYKSKRMKYDWTTDAVLSGKVFQGRPKGR